MTKDVMRYHFINPDDGSLSDGSPHPDGEWVRYDDIKHLLAMSPPVAKERLLEWLRAQIRGAKFPDFDGGYDEAIEDVIAHVQASSVEPTAPRRCYCGAIEWSPEKVYVTDSRGIYHWGNQPCSALNR